MDYFEMYKYRVVGEAKDMKECELNELERTFMEYLLNTPTCNEVQITDPLEIGVTKDTKRVLCSIVDRTVGDKKAKDEKILLVPKNSNVEVGCLVQFDNYPWLINFKEHKSMDTYKKFIMRKCNQSINFKYKNKIYKIPISLDNLTIVMSLYIVIYIEKSSKIGRNYCKVVGKKV